MKMDESLLMKDLSATPVEEGKEYDVEIDSVGEKGDGIAKIDGFIIFVPDVSKGDKVKVKVIRVLRNYAFGEVVK
jgi:predicted RNA-binding protein with TRAM domain